VSTAGGDVPGERRLLVVLPQATGRRHLHLMPAVVGFIERLQENIHGGGWWLSNRLVG